MVSDSDVRDCASDGINRHSRPNADRAAAPFWCPNPASGETLTEVIIQEADVWRGSIFGEDLQIVRQ